MSMPDWISEESLDNLDPKTAHGFVYEIRNELTGRLYIGKKFLWVPKYRMVKQKNGKKKRQRYLGPSDWKTYWGSNAELLEDIKRWGHENFTRRILHLCESKAKCAYMETKEQFARDVLLNATYYNAWVCCKITRKHLQRFMVIEKSCLLLG